MRTTAVIVIGSLALTMSAAVAAESRPPQADYMVHMDLSSDPPRYIPNQLVLLPGGLVQLMLFGKGDSHTLTLDTPGFGAAVPPGTQDGYYERADQFHAPTTPGTYQFHDKYSAATGTLVVEPPPVTMGVREAGYDLHFDPDELTVTPGQLVMFRDNGSFAHTLTSATNAWNDSVLHLKPGQGATFTAPTAPGDYAFYCQYHKDGGMRGLLHVTQVQTSSPATPGPTASTRGTPAPTVFAIVGILLVVAIVAIRKKL